MERPFRVVVARSGRADADRMLDATARELRDDGFEVIDAGISSSAAQVAETVLQEDAEAVVLAADLPEQPLLPMVVSALGQRGLDDVIVVGGGSFVTGTDDANRGHSDAPLTEQLTRALKTRMSRSY